MTTKRASNSADASKKITKKIRSCRSWGIGGAKMLARARQLIHNSDPDVVEEWKWEKPSSGGTPVWSHDGGICTGESYKQVVKLTSFRGASLEDPKKLFNSGLAGGHAPSHRLSRRRDA